jgi:hypothetical protein
MIAKRRVTGRVWRPDPTRTEAHDLAKEIFDKYYRADPYTRQHSHWVVSEDYYQQLAGIDPRLYVSGHELCPEGLLSLPVVVDDTAQGIQLVSDGG